MSPKAEEDDILKLREIPYNKKISIEKVVDLLYNQILNNDCGLFFLRGEMGTGKTTLVQDLCKRIEVVQDATSPSFALLHKYDIKETSSVKKIANFERVAHLDLHRLKSNKILTCCFV